MIAAWCLLRLGEDHVSGLGSVRSCVVSDLLAGAELSLTCIRAVACCRSSRAPLTGAAPEKSHAIPVVEPQALNLKRWNHAVSMLPSICVRRELHAKVWHLPAAG